MNSVEQTYEKFRKWCQSISAAGNFPMKCTRLLSVSGWFSLHIVERLKTCNIYTTKQKTENFPSCILEENAHIDKLLTFAFVVLKTAVLSGNDKRVLATKNQPQSNIYKTIFSIPSEKNINYLFPRFVNVPKHSKKLTSLRV